jgi:hypothetical protein
MALDPSSSQEQLLVAEYHVATERYTAAVGELSQQRSTMEKTDYQKLLQIYCRRRRDSAPEGCPLGPGN